MLEKIKQYLKKCSKENLKIGFEKYFKSLCSGPFVGAKYIFPIFISILIGIVGADVGTGLPKIVDFLIFSIIGFLILTAVTLGMQIVIFFLRKFSITTLSFIISFFIISMYFVTEVFVEVSDLMQVSIALSFTIVEVAFFTTLWATVKRKKNKAISIILTITLCANAIMGMWVFSEGKDEGFIEKYLALDKETINQGDGEKSIASLALEEGKFKVNKLTYGVNEDDELKTRSVDLSSYIGGYNGLNGKLRTLYWGFDEYDMPIDGTVWYPEGQGPFPLVIIVHGNHTMVEPSDEGYEYLGEHLASKGYIVASANENFLNFYIDSGLSGENDARAVMLLNHVGQFEDFNNDKSTDLYKKVDLDNVSLVGHSRGGEAVALAAQFNKLDYYPDNASIKFDFNYNIKSIFAVAPTYNQYKPAQTPNKLEDINYFVMQGANDQDVTTFQGIEQYNNTSFTGDGDYFKGYLYVYGANHGQFNSEWGREDLSKPRGWFLNKKSLIDEKEQKKILKAYLTAFLETTLKGKDEYREILKNYRESIEDLPRTVYMNGYEDSSFKTIANYSEDVDVTTTTLKGGKAVAKNVDKWREKVLEDRDYDLTDNSVVQLRWISSINGNYEIDLRNVTNFCNDIDENSMLQFSVGRIDDDYVLDNEFNETDFSVVIQDKQGNKAKVKVGDYYTLYPPFKVNLYKGDILRGEASIEHHMQTVRLSMKEFLKDNPKLNTNSIGSIKFLFDQSPKGDIVLDNIGIDKK